ncbi:C4-dicarboxylate ABC transporter [Spirochaetia bacterium]|nr:C4-dicarboxylate ABC transporter [Spirochaetia bacterium]
MVHEKELTDKEIEELTKQFDKESNVRQFIGVPGIIVKALLLLFGAYVFWVTLFVSLPEQVRRCSFLALLVLIGYILYPIHGAHTKRKNHLAWYDLVLGILGASCFLYYVFNFQVIVNRAIALKPQDIAIGAIGIIILAELCRRVVGIPILVVAAGFIIYAFVCPDHYSLKRIVHQLFYTTEGIIGTPIGVCSTFIVLFIFLAAFLEKSGVASFFIDLANSVAGFASGGPAKVAVIASALEGMYSGSSVANTVGSGSVTIPVMKKTGYKPEFAAAVEAAASTGGQIMPPIMGAAAFLMSEYTNLPYARIAVAAILPALLYFTGIFLMIHFEAKKLGLKGLPKESIPKFFPLLLAKGYLFLPVLVLVGFMNWFTPAKSACFAILSILIVSVFKKETRFTPATFADALAAGSRNTIGVAMACALAGIVVGIVSLTGLGQILVSVLVGLSRNNLLLALFFTMISCIILGMGIPTTANYVIMATITAPIVMAMEISPGIKVPVLAAHMFVFYFGIVADITPPVALAAYAGAAIAKSNPIKTGITATRLAITAFIIPYIFVLSPAMLFIFPNPGDPANALKVVQIIITSLIGMWGVASGIEGYMFKHMPPIERIMALAGGLGLIDPGFYTDLVGIGLIAVVFILQFTGTRKQKAAAGV